MFGLTEEAERAGYMPKAKYAIVALLVLSFIMIGWVGQAQSQTKYPTRDITIVVPFSPGGSTDLADRVMARHIQKKWGVNVNVVNKAGGNTIPATLEVYNSKPDGYTIFGDCQPGSSMLLAIMKDLPIKVMDRVFIAMTGYSPMILITPSSSPYKTLDDIVAEARRDPEGFTWTSLGGASAQDYSIRQFMKIFKIDALKSKPVMSKGGSQAAALTAGGHVKLGSGTATSAMAVIKSGDVKPLVITSKKRHQIYPDVPTSTELGYPGLSCVYWIGVSAPPKTPSYVVDIWTKALKELMNDQAYIADMDKVGTTAQYEGPEEMIKYIKAESEEVKELWSVK